MSYTSISSKFKKVTNGIEISLLDGYTLGGTKMKLYIDPSDMEYNQRVLKNLSRAAHICESGSTPRYMIVITEYDNGRKVIDIMFTDNLLDINDVYEANPNCYGYSVETKNQRTYSIMMETIVKLHDMYSEALQELNSTGNELKSFRYNGEMLVLRRNDDKMFSVNKGSLFRQGTSSVRMKFKYSDYNKRKFLLMKTSPQRVSLEEVHPNGTVINGDGVIITMLQLDELLDVIRP